MLILSLLMNYMAISFLMRCVWSSKFQALIFNNLLQIYPLGLPCLGVEDIVVVVAAHTIVVVDLSTTTVAVVPISLMMLLPLPNLHARFVESLDTQIFTVVKVRNPLPSLTLANSSTVLIILLRFCQLRTLGTLMPRLPIISLASSSTSICHMRIIPVGIKSV
jgi:hypothetical protein